MSSSELSDTDHSPSIPAVLCDEKSDVIDLTGGEDESTKSVVTKLLTEVEDKTVHNTILICRPSSSKDIRSISKYVTFKYLSTYVIFYFRHKKRRKARRNPSNYKVKSCK